jgi:hypothetical protein
MRSDESGGAGDKRFRHKTGGHKISSRRKSQNITPPMVNLAPDWSPVGPPLIQWGDAGTNPNLALGGDKQQDEQAKTGR